MSAVLATDRLETAARTLACLRAQTIRDRLEIVLVSTSGEPLDIARDELAGFAGDVLVVPEKPVSLPFARAAGIRAARAPLVFVAETHGFPHPEMAERLVAAIRPPWTAAVPGFCNANPDGAVSWSNLISDYGQWLASLPGGERSTCPPYNTVFQRSFVAEELERDEYALAPGYDLVARLRAGGHRIYGEPAAQLDHVNVSHRRTWLPQRFVAGRSQAAVRVTELVSLSSRRVRARQPPAAVRPLEPKRPPVYRREASASYSVADRTGPRRRSARRYGRGADGLRRRR